MGLTKPLAECPSRIVRVSHIACCLLSAIMGVFYLAFDPVVKTIILKKLVLSNTSENFFLWEDPPIDPYFKVFFFNLTNPDDVFNGISKPKLKEVGPFTYHEKWLKQNITWHPNGTISYKTRKIFKYIEALSCKGCNETGDKITTLNVPVLTAYELMRDANYVNQVFLQEYLRAKDYKQWIVRSPSELMWGYNEPLLPFARYFVEVPPYDQFGYFVAKNNSLDDHLPLYTMYTGKEDPNNLSKIALYNGNTHLNFWKADECNAVRGSDGSSFSPFIAEEDTLWLFNDLLCRSMPLTFDKEISQQGLKAMRFKPRKDVFASTKIYPGNECFEEAGRETGEGVFDVSVCQFNTRIVLSWPHFMYAEEKYINSVEGLEPDRNKHGFWINIQPVTGTTMSAKARFQINLAVNRLEVFDHLSKINDTVYPILWFEDGVDELGDDIITMLNYAAIAPETYKEYMLYFLVGLGSTEVILFIFALTKAWKPTSLESVGRVRDHMLYGGRTIYSLKPLVNGDHFQPILPLLPSLESSRDTSTDHSRNSSEGSNQPYFINMTNSAFTSDVILKPLDVAPKCLLPSSGFVSATRPA